MVREHTKGGVVHSLNREALERFSVCVCVCVADSLAPGKGEKGKGKGVCFGVPTPPRWLSLALVGHTTSSSRGEKEDWGIWKIDPTG